MSEYHEPAPELSPRTRDLHRALKSLMEEIEAVDWYHQRVELCADPDLKRILEHNRDEEIEHACMTLEWIRRSMPGWDANLREFLFKEGPVVELESQGKAAAGDSGEAATAGRLNIGKLRPEEEGQAV